MKHITKRHFKVFGMFAASFYLFGLASTLAHAEAGVALAATFASLAFVLAMVLEGQNS